MTKSTKSAPQTNETNADAATDKGGFDFLRSASPSAPAVQFLSVPVRRADLTDTFRAAAQRLNVTAESDPDVLALARDAMSEAESGNAGNSLSMFVSLSLYSDDTLGTDAKPRLANENDKKGMNGAGRPSQWGPIGTTSRAVAVI